MTTTPPHNSSDDAAPRRRRDWGGILLTVATLAASLAVYATAGLTHLGQFQTADEDLWIADPTEGRIHTYWRALKYHDWPATRINDKPGATTALLSGGIGLQHDTEPGRKMLLDGAIIDRYDPAYNAQILYYYRLPLVAAGGIMILLAFVFTRAASGSTLTGVATAAFLATSPILIGISQIINPDATMWAFGFAGLMGYLAFVRTGRWRYLPVAGICLGAALASKYTSSFLILFTFFATYAGTFFLIDTFADRRALANALLLRTLGYAVYVALALGTFALIMPAAIVDTTLIYKGTFGFRRAADILPILTAVGVIAGIVVADAALLRGRILWPVLRFLRHLRRPLTAATGLAVAAFIIGIGANWIMDNRFNLVDLPFDTGIGKEFRRLSQWHRILAEWKPLVFTVPPITLGLALLALLVAPLHSLKASVQRTPETAQVLLTFLGASFILLFYEAALMQRILVHVRYSLLLYPVVALLAGVGVTLTWRFVSRHLPRHWMRAAAATAGILLLANSLWTSLRSDAPFYFNYTSDLLPRQFDVVGAWGYGGYEAAQWLNAQPDAQNLLVWSDYDGFCPFFVGKCMKAGVIKWHRGGTYAGIDYFVVTRRGTITGNTTWNRLVGEAGVIRQDAPVWELFIDDRPGNYVRIYANARTDIAKASDTEDPAAAAKATKSKTDAAEKTADDTATVTENSDAND